MANQQATATAVDRQTCVRSTDSVCKDVIEAISFLEQRSTHVNCYGILYDIGKTEFALAQARLLIDKAQKTIAETRWPTRADYDRW